MRNNKVAKIPMLAHYLLAVRPLVMMEVCLGNMGWACLYTCSCML